MIIQSLQAHHDKQSFDCGEAALNRWLSHIASQHKRKGLSSTYVLTATDGSVEILGYYALSIGELVNANLPVARKKNLPEKIPVFMLGRLAISIQHQGKGIGKHLLFDAITRVIDASSAIAGVGLVVHAKDAAVNFYKQYGFEVMMDHSNHLFLPLNVS
jgi:predicted N-acetyltransferase YhbS